MAAQVGAPSGPDDAEVAPSRPRVGRQGDLMIRVKAGEAHVTLVFRINFLRCDLNVPIFWLVEIESSIVFQKATPVVLIKRVACWVVFLGS
jgi:hypothetical protein